MQTPYVEQDCTVEHDGRKYESGGVVVTDQFIVAYLGKGDRLTDWHGNEIGTWTALSSWPIRSYITDRMYSVACVVNGVRYVGRSCGEGMSIRAKRSPRQNGGR
jgi:hypothetical protein